MSDGIMCLKNYVEVILCDILFLKVKILLLHLVLITLYTHIVIHIT